MSIHQTPAHIGCHKIIINKIYSNTCSKNVIRKREERGDQTLTPQTHLT